ncbi:MAG: hypothetical protein PHR35_21290, partial [Kiritimatiellae bacterium]|nr:hypothetical protein [Kiritimatiellia bacterium]
IDYAMWLLARAFREGGVVSTYWDLSFPIQFASPLCGLAYRLPDGRIQPGYNSLNCREFFKRLWAVQNKNGLNPGSVGSHSSNAYIFPSLPWIDSILDGERDWNLDASDLDWVDYYPIERMRSMSCPHNWGVGICWMAYFASADMHKILKAWLVQAEYVFMHDSWLNQYYLPINHLREMPQPILDWGMNGERVEYHPYWRNPFAASADKEPLISLWRIPDEAEGRILLGIFNYNRKTSKNVEIKLDLAKLGFAGKPLVMRDLYKDYSDSQAVNVANEKQLRETLKQTNAELGEPAEFDAQAGILQIRNLGPHRGRFVGIGAVDTVALSEMRKQLAVNLGEQVDAVSALGFARKDTQYCAANSDQLVACADPSVKVSSWRLPDRVLLVVRNDAGGNPKDVGIKLDLAKLGLVPALKWQEFLRLRDLNKAEKSPEAKLDYYAGELSIRSMQPNTTRLISIRKY